MEQQTDEDEFLLAMPLGDCSLLDAVSSERKVGRDIKWVRLVVLHMVECLQHLHQQGAVHCDAKPRNFCRFKDAYDNQRLLAIDMDAASPIGTRLPNWGSGNLKASTAYAPPELVSHILLEDVESPVSAPAINS